MIQRRTAWYGLFIVSLSLTAFSAASLADPKDVASLEKELTQVRAQIEHATETLSEETQKLWAKQDRLEFKDSRAVELRKKIRDLEAEQIKLRKELKVRLTLLEGVSAIEKERVQLVKELQDLKATEKLIQNELALARRTLPANE